MIPLREQEYIRELFQQELTGPVKIEFFTQRPAPVFVPGREECEYCPAVQQMLEELAHLSDKIDLRVHELTAAPQEAQRYGVGRVPATVIRGVLNRPVLYYGIPAGYQFTALIEVIVGVSRGATDLPAATKRKLKRVKRDLPVQVFVTPADPASTDATRMLAKMALENGRLRLTVIEAAEFPKWAEELGVTAVPTAIIDGRLRLAGATAESALLEQILRAAETTIVTGPARLPPGGAPLELPKSAPPADDAQPGEVRPSGLIIPRR